MKKNIPNNQATREAIQNLLNEQNYVGELKTNGFIIKRNYGVRRQPIFGIVKENQIEVTVKNEVTHQIVYLIGLIIMFVLAIFALLQGVYIIAILTLIIGSLVFVSDRHQKKKEIKEFFANIN